MLKNEDIFKGAGKACHKVPEGYFEDLQERFAAIPYADARNIGMVRSLKPYLALAACFLAILLVGNAVLRGTAGLGITDPDYTEIAYVDLAASGQFDEILNSALEEEDTITDDDVVNYLIETGTSTETIEYTRLLAQK